MNAFQNSNVREMAVKKQAATISKRPAANDRPAFITKAIGVGHPVAERRSQRLREQDRGPIKPQ